MLSSKSIKIGKEKSKDLKLRLSKHGLIVYDRTIPCTIRYNQEETTQLTKRQIDFTKYDEVCEIAHLEISNTCNMKCKYCYVQDKGKGPGLSHAGWRIIINNLAAAGIFQVSFGGGEPTLRKDLFQLAKYVKACGMNLGMTTNGQELHRLNPKLLKKYFTQINVSWHQDIEIFARALKFLQSAEIPRGINYCFSKQMAKDNEIVKFAAKVFDAELLYLVYKPVIKDQKNQISGEDVYKVAKQSANDGLKVAVDGPCVNRCMMKKKFIDVDSLGNVYPCSFVRKPIGNLLNMSFKSIWKNRGEQDECPFVKFDKEERNG